VGTETEMETEKKTTEKRMAEMEETVEGMWKTMVVNGKMEL
jgi:hypothetical protein